MEWVNQTSDFNMRDGSSVLFLSMTLIVPEP